MSRKEEREGVREEGSESDSEECEGGRKSEGGRWKAKGEMSFIRVKTHIYP